MYFNLILRIEKLVKRVLYVIYFLKIFIFVSFNWHVFRHVSSSLNVERYFKTPI